MHLFMAMKDWESAYRKKRVKARVSDIVKESLWLLKKREAKKVLDVGFGVGGHALFLAENGFDVYGIDISKTGKRIAEKKARDKKLSIKLKTADMKKIPFGDSYFDAIIAVYTIPHNTLCGLRRTISEIERVLRPGGILVATLLSKKDPRYGTGEEIEPGTFVKLDDPVESDVPHRFSDDRELNDLFSGFHFIKLRENYGYSDRRKMPAVHWEIAAEKAG